LSFSVCLFNDCPTLSLTTSQIAEPTLLTLTIVPGPASAPATGRGPRARHT